MLIISGIQRIARITVKETFAEMLLRIDKGMNKEIIKQGIILTNDKTLDAITLCSLQVRFVKQSPAFQLRAIIEEWDRDRLVRELNV